MKPANVLSAIFVFVMTMPAYAYIDPVTGSFLLQAIVGGVAAALVAIRRVREKVLSLLGIRSSAKTQQSPDDASGEK